jgi:predicted O-methyltransferase YrrM
VKPPEYRFGHGGILRKSLCALVGLRPPASEHTEAEGALLRKYSLNAKTIVEIGVAEGASAWEVRQGMAADGDLYLIDPYPFTRFGRLCPARLVAHRLVGTVTRGRVTWLEEFSQPLASSWSTPIDFLFIDGDHSYEGVKGDWNGWTPHLAGNGHVALHDARVEAPWTDAHTGPVRLLSELRKDPGWEVVSEVDSLAVLRRATFGPHA